MSEGLDFEDELASLMDTFGDDSGSSMTDDTNGEGFLPSPVAAPRPQSERPKEKVLSQAEIDALLASMMNND
jgi:hypothetical protein